MNASELIVANIIDNNNFAITPEKVREVLNQMVAEYQAAAPAPSQYMAEKYIRTFPGVSVMTEHDFMHTLDSLNVDVKIYVDGQLLPNSEFSFVISSENDITIFKPTGIGWTDAEVIIFRYM